MPLHTSLPRALRALSPPVHPGRPALRHTVVSWGMACGLCASMIAPHLASAQSVHRNVGADGRVTYSDRPSPTAAAAPPVASAPAARASAPTASELPYAVQQSSQRYPVTLYTTAACAPCDAARSLLVQRGVPYTERTISSDMDFQALQRLSGQDQLPFATVGRQHLRGWEAVEWQRYLDLAGYPATSALPPHWRAPPPMPLVPPAPASAASTADSPPPDSAAAPATARPAPPSPLAPRGATPSNPAGIVF